MPKIFKKKLWIVIFSLLAVVMAAVGFFSVSYAKWTEKGESAVRAAATTGEWKMTLGDILKGEIDSQPATKAVGKLHEALSEEDRARYPLPTQRGDSTQLGGLIAADGTVKAAVWINSGRKPFGYTLTRVPLKKGDTFTLSAFNRIIDPTNQTRSQDDDGYAVLRGNAFDDSLLTYGQNAPSEERVVFHVEEDGFYTIAVYENTERDWFQVKDNQYVVTVTYSRT